MSTYNFKKIGDVDVINSVNDSAHVIIEDAGVLKKMAAKNIGAVKTINGVEPDADGNVQVEVAASGVSSWNDLEDKPFYEDGTTIEWDGNTDGRDAIAIGDGFCYKISDKVPTVEDVIGGTLTITSSDELISVKITSEHIMQGEGAFTILCALVVQDTNIAMMGQSYTFPSTGIYSMAMGGELYVSGLAYDSTKTLDEKFIPSTIARMEDIPCYDKGDAIAGEEVFPQTLIDFNNAGAFSMGGCEVSFELQLGEKYIVTIDGQDYVEEAKPEAILAGSARLGESYLKFIMVVQGYRGNDIKPFMLATQDGEMSIFIQSAEPTHTISIHKAVSIERKTIYENENVEFQPYMGSYINLIDIPTPILGQEYDVIWDGKQYKCEAKTHEMFGELEDFGGAVYLGNAFYGMRGQGMSEEDMAAAGIENTGEPFCLVSMGDGAVNSLCAEETMSADAEKTVGVAIDKQLTGGSYENVLVATDCAMGYASEVGLYAGGISTDIVLESGATYKVTYNNVEYVCTCVEVGGACTLGNVSMVTPAFDNTGEPFVIAKFSDDLEIYESIPTQEIHHSVKLSGYVSGVKKLNAKYLPGDAYVKREDLDTLASEVSALTESLNTLTASVVTVHSGTAEPTSSVGADGDVYLVTGA